MQVIAIIGDLVDSKALKERAAFQRRLVKVLAQTSRSGRSVASPYTITLGDEFQAVYRKADTVLADVVTIMAEIHPVRARFALGLGELTTRINPERALGMDGPAFHRARAALVALKADGRLLRVAGASDDPWALANHVLNLLSHELEGWTKNRLLVLAGLLQGRTVKEVEAGLKISRVAVYKNIRAAALDEVAGICHELTRALNQALRET
ncbi:MAG TPA: SatD family protein [Opitutus sp.]|nr:SatD family protein [Opitutus sp.]